MSSSNRIPFPVKRPADSSGSFSTIKIEGMLSRSRLEYIDDQGKQQAVYLQHDPEKHYRSGGTALIKQAWIPGKGKYAVKIYSRSLEEPQEELMHIQERVRYNLSFAQHTVKAHQLQEEHAFYLQIGNKVYAFFPWIEGTNVADLLDDAKMSVESRADIARQMIERVNSLHQANHIHGDIKLGNFIRDRKRSIHLIDHDGVRVPGEKGSYPYSRYYMDKTLSRKKYCYKFADFNSDVYALGVSILALFQEVGEFTEDKENCDFMDKRVLSAQETQKIQGLDPHLEPIRQILSKMLAEDPKERPNLGQVLEVWPNISRASKAQAHSQAQAQSSAASSAAAASSSPAALGGSNSLQAVTTALNQFGFRSNSSPIPATSIPTPNAAQVSPAPDNSTPASNTTPQARL